MNEIDYTKNYKNVDTGFGLDRLLAFLNGVTDGYKTDLFLPVIAVLEEKSGKSYDDDEDARKAMRIVADHIRTATMLIGDVNGILPSNVGAGYILRRLLRRAIRYARKLGLDSSALTAVSEIFIDKIYDEAKKYVGTPYVWGGSSPDTGFDCSGYVCWVYNQNGYNVGRTTANGLWNKCQHISEAEAKPGDLVFFKGTYDTPGMSHVGIYLGNGKMVSAGDPIKYADIHSSYWQQYLAGFGRLSK